MIDIDYIRKKLLEILKMEDDGTPVDMLLGKAYDMMSMKELCNKLNVSTFWVRDKLKKFGIPLKDKRKVPKKPEIRNMTLEEWSTMTLHELSNKYKCSPSTVRIMGISLGFPPRNALRKTREPNGTSQ